jgi:hypothetical protein
MKKTRNTRILKCEIYAGDIRVRSFPEDASLKLVRARKQLDALVLDCERRDGSRVRVQTTLPYLLIEESVVAAKSAKPLKQPTALVPCPSEEAIPVKDRFQVH